MEDSTPSDLPPLEEPAFTATSSRSVILDFTTLPMGNPASTSDIEEAQRLKKVAIGLRDDGDIEKAVLIASQGIEVAPGLAFPLLLRAELLERLGQTAAAERDLREACNRAPDNATAHKELARALKKRGLLKEALDEYRVALNLDPDSDVAEEEIECHKKWEEDKKMEEGKSPPRESQQKTSTDDLPSAFKVLAEEARSLSPDAAARLLSDSHVASLMGDKDFADKLGRLASDPNHSADLLRDPQFMGDMAAVIAAINRGRK